MPDLADAVTSAPTLVGDFCLVPVEERTAWRNALARDIVEGLRLPSGYPLPAWKIEEQIAPINLAVTILIEQGITDVPALQEHFDPERVVRIDYATSK